MASHLVSKVELIVSCRNLIDADILSKSDPMVALFIKHGTKDFIEFGRTEVVMNNLNPDFNKAFLLDYYFEEIQQLKFLVYDIDSSSAVLADHDFLGEFQCNLGELVSRSSIEATLRGRGVRGKIIIRCSEIDSCKELFTFVFAASGLPKKSSWFFSGKCDPFLEIHRVVPPVQFTGDEIWDKHNLQFVLAHRTEHASNTQNPQWKQFMVRNWRLCQGDSDRLLRIDILNWRLSGRCELIGSFYTSINSLRKHEAVRNHFKLVSRKQSSSTSHDSCRVTLVQFRVETEFTFVDYISGGTQLHFTVAVDFTASNGPQNNPMSLHHCPQDNRYGGAMQQSGVMNQYELAISSVGRIIEDYDYDKMFPALGFGAKIPPRMELSHCFPMTFQAGNPLCYRVDGLLQAYQSAVRQVTLFGPTNFAPCIRHMQRTAEQCQDGSQYFVLLIITDGVITDMDKTIDCIVDCSYLPMSIIIVGVGSEDFSAMDMLDCDNGLLRSGMKIADRDIVQFVPLRDYVNRVDTLNSQANLARSVLAELPEQVVQWMRKHYVHPKPNPSTDNVPFMMPLSPTYVSQQCRSSFSIPNPPYPSLSPVSMSYPSQPPPYSSLNVNDF